MRLPLVLRTLLPRQRLADSDLEDDDIGDAEEDSYTVIDVWTKTYDGIDATFTVTYTSTDTYGLSDYASPITESDGALQTDCAYLNDDDEDFEQSK